LKRMLAVLAVILVFGTDLSARHMQPPHPRVADDTLAGKVRGALYANLGSAAAGRIDVAVQDGFVFLYGEVPSERLRSRAELVAERVAGVRSVSNELVLARNRAAQGSAVHSPPRLEANIAIVRGAAAVRRSARVAARP